MTHSNNRIKRIKRKRKLLLFYWYT